MQALDSYITEVKTLPAAPRVLSELLGLLSKSDSDASQIVELISFDPALTAKVLQRCNNAAAGLGGNITDLDNAVAKMGFNSIYRLVAMVIGESMLGKAQKGYGIAPGQLWEHSAMTAVAAKTLASKRGDMENVAFTAALLHDIGKLVLGAFLDDLEQSMPKLRGPSGVSFLQAEKSVLGAEHAEIGGRVLEGWNFPETLVGAVRHHHDPTQDQVHEQLAAYVHLGDVVAHCIKHSQKYEFYQTQTQRDALQILEIDSKEMDGYVLETEKLLKQSSGFSRTKA